MTTIVCKPVSWIAVATLFGGLIAVAISAAPQVAPARRPIGGNPSASPAKSNPAIRPSSSSTADKKPAAPFAASPEKSAGNAPATRREELFVDWPAPKAAVVISGMLDGHIEPCGCTGLSNQKGGLMRRHTLIKQLMADWKCDVVPVDVGQHVNRTGRQAEIKFQRLVDAYKAMKYQAVALGPTDLRLSTGELYTAMVGSGDAATPFVSANVGVFGFDEKAVPFYRIVHSGGLKIGLTSVLGDSYPKQLASDELKFRPAAAALAAIAAPLRAAKCDVLVLLAHATMKETEELAAKFPEYHLVVTSGGAEEPLRNPKRLANGGMLIEVGKKGIYAGVVGVYDAPGAKRFRYQLVPLDARFTDSAEIVKIMSAYQAELHNTWETGLSAYGLKPIDDTGRRQFVGSAKCGECHTKAYEIWQKTPHAHATESLVHPPERKEIARNFDAECLSCHVTGWEPQQFVPYLSGYRGLGKKETPHLAGSGCENCHGPGSKHVAAEEAADDAKVQRQHRQEMVLKLEVAERTCIKCHDLENSPDFHQKDALEKYWERVKHAGKD